MTILLMNLALLPILIYSIQINMKRQLLKFKEIGFFSSKNKET
jgi:hypothetical protein